MIRRHFLAGAVGIRALCAATATATASGIGTAADAATVDRVTMTLTGEYYCLISGCEQGAPIPPVTSFFGLPVGEALTGFLKIGDKEGLDGSQEISFEYNGTIANFGWFKGWLGDEHYHNYFPESSLSFDIFWNGLSGSLLYENDGAPHYLKARADITLAPVPLPASTALLPLGVGALALMRRRRLI